MVVEPLKAATRELRRVRKMRPKDPVEPYDWADWRSAMAQALDGLADVLLFEEDRHRARSDAAAARAEAAHLRAGSGSELL